MTLLIYQKIVSCIKNHWWLGFALFLTILWGILYVLGIVWNNHFTMLERFVCSTDIFGLLALWGLGLQKRFFKQLFWQLFIFINASLFILAIIFGRENEPSPLGVTIMSLTLTIVYIPYYTGLFIYAFRARQIWNEAGYEQNYPHYKWAKLLNKKLPSVFKSSVTAVLIIMCLTFIPVIIINNRIIYPIANPPEVFEHMLKYRRTTIPELQEFERLFPNYLCELSHRHDATYKTDNNGKYVSDPNSPVTWSLIAGLYKHYLLIMEIDLVYAKVDPETGKVLSPGSNKEPNFILYEVTSPVSSPFSLFYPRRVHTSYKSIKKFDANEWRHIVETQGDFAALGIQLDQNAPIPNFELAFRNNDITHTSH